MEEEIKDDGKAYKNLHLETLEKQIEASKIWSEGRKTLEELLLYCMQNGIKTVSCCAGHYDKEGGEINKGYIGFDIKDEKTKDIVLKLLASEVSKKENSTVVMHKINNSQESETNIYLQNEENMDDVIFTRLLEKIRGIVEEKDQIEEINYKLKEMLEPIEMEYKGDIFLEIVYNSKKDEVDSHFKINNVGVRGCEKMEFEKASKIIDFIKKDISVNNEKEKMLENLISFFKTDMKIKEGIVELVPSEFDCCNEDCLNKYADKLYKSLKEFEIQFEKIEDDFGFDDTIKEATKRYFERTRNAFELSKYDEENIRGLYIHKFLEMTPQLIEDTKEECYGYNLSNIAGVIDEVNSINELLHVYHSYIENNEKILQSTPKIESKINDIEEPITLYGEENEISRQIYDKYPSDLDCGITDIVSMEDKIIIMVRDVGHALMIDIDTTQERALVKYNIPKVCNRMLVELLPGINKESITDNGARGLFEVKTDELAEKLFDLIKKVPRDEQYVFPQTNMKDLAKRGLYGITKSDTSKLESSLLINKDENSPKDKNEGVSFDD